MGMSFKPKSEKDIQAEALAPAGTYDFDVLQATDEISKSSGNPMIKVKLGLYNEDGRIKHHVFDYLLASMEAKLRHFCDTVGLLAEYERGELSAEMCKGRSGRVKIIVDDKDEAYPPKNAVRDYVIRPAKALQTEPDTKDEDDPFA